MQASTVMARVGSRTNAMKKLLLIPLICLLCGSLGYSQGTTIGARYQEVVALDVTPDEDLALTIEFKTLLNGVTDPIARQAFPQTPGAYLAAQVQTQILSKYVANRITGEQDARITDALAKANVATKQKVAMDLGVDLTVTPPATQGGK